MCKRFLVDLLKMREHTEQVVYRTGTKPKCSMERTMIYEMFVKLDTSEYKPGRRFDRFYVKNVVTKLDTVLTDKKLESRIKGKQDDEAYAHFSSIGQIYDDVELALNKTDDEASALVEEAAKLDKTTSDEGDSKSKENGKETEVNVESAGKKISGDVVKSLEKAKDTRLAQIMDDDRNRCEPDMDEPEDTDTKKDDDKISKKLGYSRFMIDNPWEIGTRRLAEARVKETREGARKRLHRNIRIKRACGEKVRRDRNAPIEKLAVVDETTMPSYASRIMELYPEFYNE